MTYHTHISSKHSWFDLNLKEVWKYRDLIVLFTKRNFVLTYKQTILGPAWIFLNPLISSIIYAFVFGVSSTMARRCAATRTPTPICRTSWTRRPWSSSSRARLPQTA